jgi:hypothetical protein
MTAPVISTPESSPSTKIVSRLAIQGTPILAGAVLATGCAYAALNDPETKTIFPVCGFYAVTGLYCPGCGMTRALHNTVTGDITRAIRFNALLVVAIPVLMYLYVWWATWAFTGKELPKANITKRGYIIIGILITVFMVGRNLPGAVPEFFSLGRV